MWGNNRRKRQRRQTSGMMERMGDEGKNEKGFFFRDHILPSLFSSFSRDRQSQTIIANRESI
jgi:hypothetical protein